MGGLAPGIVLVSIDLELDLSRSSPAWQSRLAAATEALISLCEAHGVRATWGVADPAHSAATEEILAADGGHEIAILADPQWAGSAAGRLWFHRELSRRCQAALRSGVAVSSLVLRSLTSTGHDDLLARHGITALRDARPRPAVELTHRAPWQVVQLPVTCQLLRTDPWWPWLDPEAEVARQLRRAAADGGYVHLSLDASDLLEDLTESLGSADRILESLARLQAAGDISLRTMSELAAERSQRAAARPARSILHAA